MPSPPISKTLSAIERGYLITDMQSRAAGIMSSGATAVTCLVNSSTNKLYSANCGDARAVLVRENYKALRLTHDHKADDPEEIQVSARTSSGPSGMCVNPALRSPSCGRGSRPPAASSCATASWASSPLRARSGITA